jgi:hypothetical protein
MDTTNLYVIDMPSGFVFLYELGWMKQDKKTSVASIHEVAIIGGSRLPSYCRPPGGAF